MSTIATPPTIDLLPAAPLPTDTEEQHDQKAYAMVAAMINMVPQINASNAATKNNAQIAKDSAATASAAASAAGSARDTTVAAKDVTVSAKDTAVASANTASNAATTATAGANTATAQANRAQGLVDSISNITTGPVIAFNDRTGAVTLNAGDISGAGGVLAAMSTIYDSSSLMSDAPLGQWASFATAAGPGADWPGMEVVAWWNVFTFGVNGRRTQIAYQAFGTIEQSLSFIRSSHDGAWSRWSPLGKKPVRYITDNANHMHGGNGERALNAINLWLYGADTPRKYIPSNPAFGDECTIVMANGRTDSQLFPAPSGEPIMGLNEVMTIDRTNIAITFVYVGGTYGWRII